MLIVVAGICIRNGKVLLSQRPPGKHLAGTWEFPGGKIDAGETPEEALVREFREELDVGISDIEAYTFVHHQYPEKEVLLLFYTCQVDGTPTEQENNPVRWVCLEDLPEIDFPEADKDLVSRLSSQA